MAVVSTSMFPLSCNSCEQKKKSGPFTDHDPTRGSGHEVFQTLTGRVGSGQKKFLNLTGRVGSGQEVFKISRTGRVSSGLKITKNISRVGSGHDP